MASSAPHLENSRTFEPHEVALSIAFSAAILSGFFTLLVLAGQSKAHVAPAPPPPPAAMPIAVRPVLDELPLLKLGGKKVRSKLPDMWKKKPPVQRHQASSAPSTKASKTPDSLPDTPLAKPSSSAPPPDAEVAKQVDQVLLEETPEAAPTVEGEGSPDGVKEGTETDPLKARAVSAYRAKILAWFNSRFQAPDGIPCAELKKLIGRVSVSVGQDRRVTAYQITSPSGNSVFDERVRGTMDRIIGEELPPPPPLYPDILGTTQQVSFSGNNARCNDSTPNPSPRPQPAPEAPGSPAPAQPNEPAAPPAPPPERAPAPADPSPPSDEE